jgi:hypothetical protein
MGYLKFETNRTLEFVWNDNMFFNYVLDVTLRPMERQRKRLQALQLSSTCDSKSTGTAAETAAGGCVCARGATKCVNPFLLNRLRVCYLHVCWNKITPAHLYDKYHHTGRQQLIFIWLTIAILSRKTAECQWYTMH